MELRSVQFCAYVNKEHIASIYEFKNFAKETADDVIENDFQKWLSSIPADKGQWIDIFA